MGFFIGTTVAVKDRFHRSLGVILMGMTLYPVGADLPLIVSICPKTTTSALVAPFAWQGFPLPPHCRNFPAASATCPEVMSDREVSDGGYLCRQFYGGGLGDGEALGIDRVEGDGLVVVRSSSRRRSHRDRRR